MDSTGTGTPASTDAKPTPAEEFAKVLEALKNSKVDQQALSGLLAPLFDRLIGEAISVAETLLPERETNSREGAQFFAARQRILRVGNNAKREMETNLQDFVVHQVYKREVVARVVAQPHGPYGLPRGVHVRGKEPQQPHGKR